MRAQLLLSLTALLVVVVGRDAVAADPNAVWLEFPAGAFPVGVTTTVHDTAGTLVDVTVQTGGSQGVTAVDLDTLGVAETGLAYADFPGLGIYNGGGFSAVPTSLTFSNIRVAPGHQRGLLMVGAVSGLSSPITVSSSIAGRVATWSVVGQTFEISADNSFPITWDPSTGELETTASGGIDSGGIVLDLGDLRSDGTVTVSLNQHLSDGILYSFGETLSGSAAVPPQVDGPAITLSAPRPSPAFAVAELAFSLPAPAHVRLAAYDLEGRRVATLADADFAAGTHTLRWDLRDRSGNRLRPGVVLVRLEAPGATLTRRLLIIT